jgi:hypothetical protein
MRVKEQRGKNPRAGFGHLMAAQAISTSDERVSTLYSMWAIRFHLPYRCGPAEMMQDHALALPPGLHPY